MAWRNDDPTAQMSHLLTSDSGTCWWCQSRAATTREHKYKKSDLKRIYTSHGLVWGSSGEPRRKIYGINRAKPPLSFRKSLCAECNNERSQPFDHAYSQFASWIAHHNLRWNAGVDFRRIYGTDWKRQQEQMGRYYAKHFGCRMVEVGLPVPESLRIFLETGESMPDAYLALVYNDHYYKDRRYRDGLILSSDLAYSDSTYTKITGIVQAAFIGPVGLRYEWWDQPPNYLDSFMGHSIPILNRFRTEDDVLAGNPAPMRATACVQQAIGWVRERRWAAVGSGW